MPVLWMYLFLEPRFFQHTFPISPADLHVFPHNGLLEDLGVGVMYSQGNPGFQFPSKCAQHIGQSPLALGGRVVEEPVLDILFEYSVLSFEHLPANAVALLFKLVHKNGNNPKIWKIYVNCEGCQC